MKLHDISVERVRELLSYDPETGVFRNRVYRSSVALRGDIAGCYDDHGYWKIRLDRHYMKAHRLAWFYVHGEWPEEIDHINGVRSDNRLCNLRPATRSLNCLNRPNLKPGKYGLKGVDKKGNSFRSYICISGKKVNLGYFKTAEEAHERHRQEWIRLHGPTIEAA